VVPLLRLDITIESPTGATRTSSAIGNRVGFQGQPFDRAVGLVDMRNRAYRPSLGRFLTRDPIGYAGRTNLHAFVDSSPLLYVDPFGLDRRRKYPLAPTTSSSSSGITPTSAVRTYNARQSSPRRPRRSQRSGSASR
jgi:RHS repeat-associated protein